MSHKFVINATSRSDCGKGASRRLRRNRQVPGIVYGANRAPQNISVDHNELQKLLVNEAAYTSIIGLDVGDQKDMVILRDLQRHPFKPAIMHLDLQRISEKEKLTVRIPLHFVGMESAPGVKIGGGSISKLMTDVEVHCFPKELPEYVEVDLSGMELNQVVHLSDLKLPSDVDVVALLHGEDRAVVTLYLPKSSNEDNSTTPGAAEVPVIGKGGKDEGGGESATDKGKKDK